MNFKKIGIISLSLLFILGTVGITIRSLPFAVAQEGTRSIDERLDQLSEQILQLANTVNQNINTSETPNDIDPESELPEGTEHRSVISPDGDYIFDNPSCFDDYMTWPSSTTFREDAPWSLSKIPTSHILLGTGSANDTPQKQFLDINGDGLLDFIYSLQMASQSEIYEETNGVAVPTGEFNYGLRMYDCLGFNTGSGWEYKYRCFTGFERQFAGDLSETNATPIYNNYLRFYGDCADTENP